MKLITIASAVLLTAVPALAGNDPVQKRGTDVLHYSAREAFAAAPEVVAEGGVSLSRKEQGNAQKQTLDIVLKKLQPTSSYFLLSLPVGETNYSYVTSFDSDSKGNAKLRYVTQGNGNSLGRGKQVLPQELNPVTALSELVIMNSSTQAVATADLTDPDKLSYLVKRNLSTSETGANLRIKANQKLATLKLVVTGLSPTAEYWLAVNGTITETNTAPSGELVIDRRFDDPLEIISLRSLYLYDTQTNVVVGTMLP